MIGQVRSWWRRSPLDRDAVVLGAGNRRCASACKFEVISSEPQPRAAGIITPSVSFGITGDGGGEHVRSSPPCRAASRRVQPVHARRAARRRRPDQPVMMIDQTGDDDPAEHPSEYAWEQNFERTWEKVTVAPDGTLRTAVSRTWRAERPEVQENVKRGVMRTFFLVLDCSHHVLDSDLDMKPSRLAVIQDVCAEFITKFFEQNPISSLAVLITKEGRAEMLTEPAEPARLGGPSGSGGGGSGGGGGELVPVHHAPVVATATAAVAAPAPPAQAPAARPARGQRKVGAVRGESMYR